MSGFGPTVVFDEVGYGGDLGQGKAIWLANLELGTLRELADSIGGDAAWMPVIRNSAVAWVEWHYADNVAFSGDLSWRVRLADLATDSTATLLMGVSPGSDGPGGIPLVALTDQAVVVAYPSSIPSNAARWRVDALALSDKHSIVSLISDQWVYSLAASDDVIAFTKGKVNIEGHFVYDTSLMYATSLDTSPRELAHGSFEIAVDADRIVWVDDRAASEGPSPAQVAPRIYEATGAAFDPESISPVPNREPIVGSSWPSAGGGHVTWTDNHDAPPKYPDPSGDHLVLWGDSVGAVQLEPTAGVLLSAVSKDWLVWDNDWQTTLYLYGLRFRELPLN